MEVLVVEDNPGDVAMIEDALSSAAVDCSVSVVTDGEDALSFLRRRDDFEGVPRPDLVLLDRNLPKLPGLDVLESIDGDPALAAIPVVVLSGADADVDVTRSYELGANAYFVKPVDPGSYTSLVQSIVELWVDHGRFPGGSWRRSDNREESVRRRDRGGLNDRTRN